MLINKITKTILPPRPRQQKKEIPIKQMTSVKTIPILTSDHKQITRPNNKQ